MADRNIPTDPTSDPNENALGADVGMRMAEAFRQKNGRTLPVSDVEFAGMLAIAYILGRESIAGRVS